MTISGGVKFFERPFSLRKDGASIDTITTGATSSVFALDLNEFTKWESVGSDDTTTETMEIDLGSTEKTVNRIALRNINAKEFTIKYWNGLTFVDFTSAVGIDGALGGGIISETAFSDETAYYEFTSVSTLKIKINIVKTQTADEEKEIGFVMISSELGTLGGFPQVLPISDDRGARVISAISGKSNIQKTFGVRSVGLGFRQHPTVADTTLMGTLHDRDLSFIVWPCGGRRGSTFFTTTIRGFRLQDLMNMEMINPLSVVYGQSIYTNGVNFTTSFREVN